MCFGCYISTLMVCFGAVGLIENYFSYFSTKAYLVGTQKTGLVMLKIIWTSKRENLSSGFCEQHRRRPACPSATSDQCLCFSLFGEHSSKACSIQNSIFLASLCSLEDCFESRFVGNPKDRFCRDKAHMGQYARKSVFRVSGQERLKPVC